MQNDQLIIFKLFGFIYIRIMEQEKCISDHHIIEYHFSFEHVLLGSEIFPSGTDTEWSK